MGKICCLTLDLEAEHGYKKQDSFEAFKKSDEFFSFIEKENLKFTVFVLGELFDKKDKILDRMTQLNIEFGLHSYSHSSSCPLQEIESAYKAYVGYFNSEPFGYRGPYGYTNEETTLKLKKMGFRYTSSVKPCLQVKNRRLGEIGVAYDGGLMDLPVSRITFFKIPFGMGWVQLFGLNFFKIFSWLKDFPEVLVFYMHLHDIINTEAYDCLPLKLKAFYLKNRFNADPIRNFARLISFLKSKGYNFLYMSELYSYLSETLSEGL